MVCHYCGHTEPVPAKCPHCRVTEPVPMGFGTEKVEEEIARVFPEARVARLDRDSVTSERAFRQHRRGLRPGRRRYSGGDADDYQRVRFQRRGAGRCAQRRQSAQQSRFPLGGACVPTADAGGGPRRSARKSRNGRDPDRRAGTSRLATGRLRAITRRWLANS